MDQLPPWLETWTSQPWVRALAVVVASVILAKITDWIICRVVRAATARTRTDIDDRLIDQLHRPIYITVVLVGVRLAFQILDLAPDTYRVIGNVIQTFVVIVWVVAGLRIISLVLGAFSRLGDRVSWLDSRTLPLFDNVARLLLAGGGIYALLVAWNLDVTAWLASAGIVGIAVSFAAKDSLAHLFGGLFVIADSPYKIGDFINLDTGERGQVVKIGLRSTRLMTRDDVEGTAPNGGIANAKIVNEAGGPWQMTRVSVTVGVAYGSDVEQVRKILNESARSVDYVVDDPEPRVRFIEMGDSALIFRVLCWVREPVLRGRCIDGLNTAIYKQLNQAGITIPFPQRDIHLYQATPARATD